MKPKLGRTDGETTLLVKALRSNITALRHNLDVANSFLGKPANRIQHETPANTLALSFLADCDQTDLSKRGIWKMARQIGVHLSILGRNQDAISPSTTALLNPDLI